MDKEFESLIIKMSKDINVELEKTQIQKYFNYMNLLIEWNEKINLTAITEKKDIILKHFIDSMTVLEFIENDKTLIDVGTGAGFPGIPLAIMRPEIEITLVDSLNKRLIFLNEVKNKLNLSNLKIIHSRAEDLGKNKNYRQQYDIAISRAVANMTTLSEYLLPFVKVNGKCICMKGSEIEEELEESKFAIKELGGKIASIENMILPNSDIRRNIVVIEKIKETPNKYPRKAGLPSKDPLKEKKSQQK